ncbi:UbiX family flavin prenyltransferase [Dissulfurirhabdus thermomarina]|uniref:Flavin prenyltransferase UbiX n=1 Tax=Dissulfurirhabdus thermomarina TaxID=1765737 RepID=A0A6N9TW69_DISTH|nr:UbiX family flavin prenyltransferase [Dissulfurirhabdus thermomarina]NDY43657.1 UbiX family flavin prenyltransferase [Dissulfurirhabdus thermomarina]NMX23362.1 UbiX family flavin prenyltransferase [Dissulfurirhabdus thermomarina]
MSVHESPPGSAPAAPLLVAVTGASGAPYAVRFLEILEAAEVEVHLVVSEAGARVLEIETGRRPEDLARLAAAVHSAGDLAAPPASGSTPWRGMVILPCTMGTLAAVANGLSRNLVHRAADCMLKERRPLVLVPREAPLNRVHLRNMLAAAEAGAVIWPAMPAFYLRPADLDDLVDQFARRLAAFLGIPVPGLRHWNGAEPDDADPR